MNQRLRLVLHFHQLALLLVLISVRFGVLDHFINITVGQTTRRLNTDRLFLACRLVLRRNMHDAVGVNVEGDFDLRHAARRRRDLFKIELPQRLVVAGHFALALEHGDGHRRLSVLRRGEGLPLLGGDGGVAVDQAGEHAAQGFDAQRQGRYVEQQHVLDIALQHARLNGGAHGDHFVRVDAPMRFAAKEVLHRLLNLRHTGHAANQDHFVDFGGLQSGVLEGGGAGSDRALNQPVHKAFQLGAGQLHVEMLRPGSVGGDERQVDFGLLRRRQLFLGLFRFVLQTLQGQLVAAQVNAVLFFELAGQIINQQHVEIFAAEEGVAIGALHLKHAVADFQNRNIEGAAAKVEHGDGLAFFFVEAIGERRRRRLVDDAQNFQAGDLACVLGGLTLAVVKVGRNGDNRFFHLLAKIFFGGFLHLLQDKGGDLRRRIFLALSLDPGVAIVGPDDFIGNQFLVLGDVLVVIAATDQPLDGEQGVFRVGNRLILGGLANQPLAIVRKGDA